MTNQQPPQQPPQGFPQYQPQPQPQPQEYTQQHPLLVSLGRQQIIAKVVAGLGIAVFTLSFLGFLISRSQESSDDIIDFTISGTSLIITLLACIWNAIAAIGKHIVSSQPH